MPEPITPLPHITSTPGIGGVLRQLDSDFQVEEIPAYQAEGAGDHVFVTIRKRGLTTFDAVNQLARALGVNPRDVGTAGLKDRHAVTTQVISFPPPASPDDLLPLSLSGIEILGAVRHPHKLRTGHLKGNRFTLRVRKLAVPLDEALCRAESILGELTQAPGCPNWFGEQRFGRFGDNAQVGSRIVRKESVANVNGKKRRLFISAFQSQLFNDYLRRRLADNLYSSVIPGDLLQKTDTGGIFPSSDIATDAIRLANSDVVPTGPIFGHKMKRPPEGSEAAEREDRILDNHGIDRESFRHLGKLAAGARRALAIRLGRTCVTIHDDTLEVSFDLPSGAYATVVMNEIIKPTSATGKEDTP